MNCEYYDGINRPLTREHYDFSCWIIKYDRVSIKGLRYKKDSLKNNDGIIVPLMWNHEHSDPSWILGQALLENREDGIYGYFMLYDTPCKGMIEQMIRHPGSVSTSPFVTQAKVSGAYIECGVIVEVSLTPARLDPDSCYYPVEKQSLQ